jgi:hypothetical protein
MAANFTQAALRHFKDASILTGVGDRAHLPNAMQLFGLSAECSLKAVLIGTGSIPVDPVTGGPDRREHKLHVDQLWQAFSTLLGGRSASSYLALLKSTLKPEPFDSFAVSHRYEDEAALPWSDFPNYENGATVALSVLAAAQLNGDVK